MAAHELTRNLSGLARALAQQGLMSEQEAETLQTQAHTAGVSFVEQVLAGKRMTALQLAVFASRAFGVPLLDLAGFDITQINKDYVDARTATARRVLPLHRRGNRLFVATSDPANLQALEEVRFKTNLIVESVVVEDDKLAQAIHKLVESAGSALQELASMDELEVNLVAGGAQPAAEEDTSEVDDAPVVRYIQKILLDAISAGVSDIHFEPFDKFYRIRYRLDGELMEIAQPPLVIKDKVASRIKIISRLDIAERRLPQDGSFASHINNREIDFRVSTLPTIYGEKIVLRLLEKEAVLQHYTLENLGFEPEQLEVFLRAIKRPWGMVLLTGPTGSGKSTTLHTAIKTIKSPRKNIITVEDPVEYRQPGIQQVQVKSEIGFDFSRCLRSILRQDPDIIMVGEIRDPETAQIAVRAALTGHLVLSTLHTNDAISTLVRLINIGVDPFLVATAVNVAAAQRLVKRICRHCKEEYRPSPEEIAAFAPGPAPELLYRGRGCRECRNIGYSGRMALYEVFGINAPVRRMVIEGVDADTIRRSAADAGMMTLRTAGFRRVAQGDTTLEEVMAVVADQD